MPLLSFEFVFLISLGFCYFLMMTIISAGLYKKNLHVPTGTIPSVRISVLIPVRNEQSNITHTLDDLAQQQYPEELLEIIFIDDASQDKTAEIIEDFMTKHLDFPGRLIRINPDDGSSGSKKRALAIGVSGSSGELLITTDADTRRGKNWVNSISAFYEQYHPAMILSPVAFSDRNDFFSTIQILEFTGLMAVTEGSCKLKRPLMCNGANLAYTRLAYQAADGFTGDQNIASGDDMFLMMKIRKMFGPDSVKYNHSQEAIVTTEVPFTFKEFLSQRARWVSKSKNYKDPYIIATALLTYLFNVSLLSGMISGFFLASWWLITGILLGLKMIIEFPMVASYAAFLKKKKALFLFPIAQILNVFYVVMIGVAGFILPNRWKGRSIR